MKRAEVLRVLREHRDQLRRQFGLKSLELFGSVARDEAGPNSDVDLLVEVERGTSLFDVVDAALFLERVLEVPKVDLVIRANVIPELKDIIYGEAIDVFGAAEMEVSASAHA
jgi:predicted nucleotidyltransferase